MAKTRPPKPTPRQAAPRAKTVADAIEVLSGSASSAALMRQGQVSLPKRLEPGHREAVMSRLPQDEQAIHDTLEHRQIHAHREDIRKRRIKALNSHDLRERLDAQRKEEQAAMRAHQASQGKPD